MFEKVDPLVNQSAKKRIPIYEVILVFHQEKNSHIRVMKVAKHSKIKIFHSRYQIKQRIEEIELKRKETEEKI